jgi:nicotinamidase/pyrazinamidase
VFVGGLATDYCIRATVLDLLDAGFATILLLDAVRAVDVKPGGGENAIREMSAAGAVLTRTSSVESRPQ